MDGRRAQSLTRMLLVQKDSAWRRERDSVRSHVSHVQDIFLRSHYSHRLEHKTQ